MTGIVRHAADFVQQTPVRITGDTASLGIIGATILSWMPAFAAGLAVVWWGMRIYQTWLEIRKAKNELGE